jgi:hypothetical protein
MKNILVTVYMYRLMEGAYGYARHARAVTIMSLWTN